MARSGKSKAGQQQGAGYILCSQPASIPRHLPDDLLAERASAIRTADKKWVNGTVLHYCFLNRSINPKWLWRDNQKQIVRWAFGVWKALE